MKNLIEVQLLESGAKAPAVAHEGDLGYDVFALEDTALPYGEVVSVRTGIAVAAYEEYNRGFPKGLRGDITYVVPALRPLGLLVRDRSSMAMKGIVTSGGVIDAGYRGEIKVLMTYWKDAWVHNEEAVCGSWPQDSLIKRGSYYIQAGDKIAQLLPMPVLTGEIYIKGQLDEAVRGLAGFGSSGK